MIKNLFYWWLDYWYVAYWQVRSFFSRALADQYTKGNKDQVAIVIIPGVYEPWRFMHPLIVRLFKRGHPVYVVQGIGYNTGSVPEMAKKVREAIEELDVPEVVLVAHSKGGLIGKYVLANYNVDSRVRHLIAINTPFAGSTYAYLMPIRGVRALTPSDRVIVELQANKAINSQITSIYSSFDPHIPGGSHLQGATNIRLHTIGHFRVLGRQETQSAVLEAIEHQAPLPQLLQSDFLDF